MTDDSATELEPIYAVPSNFTRNDRFALVSLLALVIIGSGLGLIMLSQVSSQTWPYESQEAGIEAVYPASWLVDEDGPYVVRIRNPRARPFKTQYVIATVPAGGETSVRNVLDVLTLQRSTGLSAYRVLSVEERIVGGAPLTEMRFSFVDADPNPFAERLPVVVLGLDIVIVDGNRAIVVTYVADEAIFESQYDQFERFLTSLRY